MYSSSLRQAASHSIAVYPYLLDEDTERFTYGIWDVSQKQLIGSLKSVINFWVSANYYPTPSWSPDNSQFALVGAIVNMEPNGKAKRDLFSITRNGQVEQITNLEGNALVWPSSHNWSPDGLKIALFSSSPGNYEEARLAVFDTVSVELTEYCVTVASQVYGFSQPPTPIWSPDGKQILVIDRYDDLRSQVFLIDMERSLIVKITDDVEKW